MSEGGNLFAQQEANRKRSWRLVIGFILFFTWLGFGGDYIYYLYTSGAEPGEYRHVVPWFGMLLSGIATLMAIWAWRSGPEKVLWAAGARELTAPATEAERRYVNVVEEMAIASGIPRPRVWLIPDPDPNALATGRDAATASVAVTEGLLEVCSRDELQAIVAHEMGHIKNLDVRLMTLLAALVGTIALVSDGVGRMMFRTGGSVGRGSRSNGKKGNLGPLVVVLLAVWLLSWLLAPVVARLLALGVSRKREFLADAMSAQFTRNPLALASALEKIESAVAPTKAIKRASAHLCIADPLGRGINEKDHGVMSMFATHPPIRHRIAQLRAMGYEEAKREGRFVPADPAELRVQ